MRYNRKACLRALELAASRWDMTVIPFHLAFNYADQRSERRIGGRIYSALDNWGSVAFYPQGVTSWSIPHCSYQSHYTLQPGLKPRSLKKHELRKQARDLRRVKQYD